MNPAHDAIRAGISPVGPIFAADDVDDAMLPHEPGIPLVLVLDGPAAGVRLRQHLQDVFPTWCRVLGLRGAVEAAIAVSNAGERSTDW